MEIQLEYAKCHYKPRLCSCSAGRKGCNGHVSQLGFRSVQWRFAALTIRPCISLNTCAVVVRAARLMGEGLCEAPPCAGALPVTTSGTFFKACSNSARNSSYFAFPGKIPCRSDSLRV